MNESPITSSRETPRIPRYQKHGASLQPHSPISSSYWFLSSVGKRTFSPVFLAVSLIGRKETMCSRTLFPYTSAGCLLSFWVLEESGSWLRLQQYLSFFPSKGMKAAHRSHFCLSKIPQRIEVESLLVSAMLF